MDGLSIFKQKTSYQNGRRSDEPLTSESDKSKPEGAVSDWDDLFLVQSSGTENNLIKWSLFVLLTCYNYILVNSDSHQ